MFILTKNGYSWGKYPTADFIHLRNSIHLSSHIHSVCVCTLHTLADRHANGPPLSQGWRQAKAARATCPANPTSSCGQPRDSDPTSSSPHGWRSQRELGLLRGGWQLGVGGAREPRDGGLSVWLGQLPAPRLDAQVAPRLAVCRAQ